MRRFKVNQSRKFQIELKDVEKLTESLFALNKSIEDLKLAVGKLTSDAHGAHKPNKQSLRQKSSNQLNYMDELDFVDVQNLTPKRTVH